MYLQRLYTLLYISNYDTSIKILNILVTTLLFNELLNNINLLLLFYTVL